MPARPEILTSQKALIRTRQIHSTAFPTNFWEWLLLQQDLRRDISRQGFFKLQKDTISNEYREWHRSRNRSSRFSGRVPSFGADFLSKTPPPLRSNNLFLLPTGSGNGIVFDSNMFSPPYVNLNGEYCRALKIPIRIQPGFVNMLKALSIQWNEQSFIKALHFCGAFAAIVRNVCKTDSYKAGPSGIIASSFPFRMTTKRGRAVEFWYEGMSDLDECIYPKDADIVMPVEAKIEFDHEDLSWHKLAFPCYRFVSGPPSIQGGFRIGNTFNAANLYSNGKKGLRVIPLYCAFNPTTKQAFIYVFKHISQDYLKHGLILNDTRLLRPMTVFQVDMTWISAID